MVCGVKAYREQIFVPCISLMQGIFSMEQSQSMKKKIWILAVLSACFSLLGYTSYAYFTAEKTAVNVITSGDVEIELLEWADLDKTIPFPQKEAVRVMPGMKVTKVVEVKNTGGHDAWVRIYLEQGEAALDINTTDWTKQDGYYYYNRPLEAGKTTEPLFSEVSFLKETGNGYQGEQVTIGVKVYATQRANNGETVLEAGGWPLTE